MGRTISGSGLRVGVGGGRDILLLGGGGGEDLVEVLSEASYLHAIPGARSLIE